MVREEFRVRLAVPDDSEFMIKTWLREQRRAPAHPPRYPNRLFYQNYQEIILTLIGKSDGRVVCLANDAHYICGFVVGQVFPEAETLVAHFAYVRPPFRRLGLATSAFEAIGYVPGWEVVASHWQDYLDRFKRDDLIHNPHVLYGVK